MVTESSRMVRGGRRSGWLGMAGGVLTGVAGTVAVLALIDRPALAATVPAAEYDAADMTLVDFRYEDGFMIRVFDNGLVQICATFHDNRWHNVGTGESLKAFHGEAVRAAFEMMPGPFGGWVGRAGEPAGGDAP